MIFAQGRVCVADQELPHGVKHLHGTLYLVKFQSLQVSDPDGEKTKEYKFSNPRLLTEQGQKVLYDKQANADIRHSIKRKGLLTPLICRWGKDENGAACVQLLGGERRHRALDYLIRNKEMVVDPSAPSRIKENLDCEMAERPADQVYSEVLCQVYSADSDLDALSLSVAENNCRENLTDGHAVAMVNELRRCGATDDRILAILEKDERWLRDTDGLLNNLDQDTLHCLIDDRISRDAALELMSIKDLPLRKRVLDAANANSERDFKAYYDRLTKRLSSQRDEHEIAEGAIVDAQYSHDALAEEQARQRLAAAEVKIERTRKERAAAAPVTKRKDVRDGIRDVTGEIRQPAALKPAAIKKHYVEPLEALIRVGGRTASGAIASTEALKLSVKLLNAILGGDTDALEIIRLHYHRKAPTTQF